MVGDSQDTVWNEPDKKAYLTSSASNMTGTSAIGGTTLNVLGRGMAVFHCNWTGTAVGTFTVHGSNDGTNWVQLNVVIPAHPNGAASGILIKVPCLTHYLKVTYTNASSSGALGIDVVTTPFSSSVEVAHVVQPGIVVTGQNTTISSASATQLTATSTPLKSGVQVKALTTNTGTIYVGAAGVTTSTGYPLAAGDSKFFEIDDVSKLYAIATVNNEDVAWGGS